MLAFVKCRGVLLWFFCGCSGFLKRCALMSIYGYYFYGVLYTQIHRVVEKTLDALVK